MSILEIIHLRSSTEPVEALTELIRESVWATGDGSDVATVYRRHGLETDVAIHIRHRGEAGGTGSRSLAVHLAQALRVYGLVEHSVWEEIGGEAPRGGGRYHVEKEGAPR